MLSNQKDARADHLVQVNDATRLYHQFHADYYLLIAAFLSYQSHLAYESPPVTAKAGRVWHRVQFCGECAFDVDLGADLMPANLVWSVNGTMSQTLHQPGDETICLVGQNAVGSFAGF